VFWGKCWVGGNELVAGELHFGRRTRVWSEGGIIRGSCAEGFHLGGGMTRKSRRKKRSGWSRKDEVIFIRGPEGGSA